MKTWVTVLLAALVLQPASWAQADGKAVYSQTCAACHATGLGGAPRLGDKRDWSARVSNGKDAVIYAALKGKGGMPPKGGNPSLSDREVISAVEYILAQGDMPSSKSLQVRIESNAADKP